MTNIALTHPGPYRYKRALLAATAALIALVGGGSIYAEQEPALSFRSIIAQLERPGIAYQFARITAPPPSGKQALTVPVLTYHRIVSDTSDLNNVTESNFKDQMAALKKAGWNTVSLPDFEAFMRGEKQLPDKSFLLTFDDGAKDSFYPTDNVLRYAGFQAVNFIIVAASEIPRSIYYLNPKEIARMIASGRWSIGSHSFDGHRPYQVDTAGNTGVFFADKIYNWGEGRLETDDEFEERVRDDLVKAKQALETTYRVPINSFAFPLGNETGINGANNYPGGSDVTETVARSIYGFGYLQTGNRHFTENAPFAANTASSSGGFLVYRIHVDHDWDGARVLGIMENGQPKSLPYEDDFSEDHGWIAAWGSLEIGRNNFVVKAAPQSTSASAFLDGTQLWDNYAFDASVNWTTGTMFVLADVVDAGTYHACAFSPGFVRIQSTVGGVTKTLKEIRSDSIAFGGAVHPGIRVHGNVIECSWEFTSLGKDAARDFKGGIGLQAWDSSPGNASVQMQSVIVRPYGQ